MALFDIGGIMIPMSTKQRLLDRLARGVEFTITGGGRYRLHRIRPNGEVNAWGPIATNGNTPRGQMRTFRPDQIATVHRKARSR